MIKHVVCYRLYERTEEKKQEVKAMFMSMKDKIEYIKDNVAEEKIFVYDKAGGYKNPLRRLTPPPLPEGEATSYSFIYP